MFSTAWPAADDVRTLRSPRIYREAGLSRDAQLRELRADLAEDRIDLPGRRDQEELACVARALRQHRRGRIAAGVDLQRVERDAGCLDVVAGSLGPRIDGRLRGGETVRRVEP